ncbi:hypothetical protein NUSPORA_02672 [Nucleospora cyclopteri]
MQLSTIEMIKRKLPNLLTDYKNRVSAYDIQKLILQSEDDEKSIFEHHSIQLVVGLIVIIIIIFAWLNAFKYIIL